MPTDSSTQPTTKVILGCAKCGANLPDEAQFCLKCGNPVTLPPKKVTVVDVPPAPPQRPPSKRRVYLWMAVAVLLATMVWVVSSDNPYALGVQEFVGWKHDQTILDNSFSVTAHNFRYYKFALPEGSTNVSIMGEFSVAAGSPKAQRQNKDKEDDANIEVYVLSEPAFAIWQNGYASSYVYESGRVAQAKVETGLPAGAGIYYLVFSNKFSEKAAKNVNATFLVRYRSWLPEWFRKMKGNLWNWLGL